MASTQDGGSCCYCVGCIEEGKGSDPGTRRKFTLTDWVLLLVKRVPNAFYQRKIGFHHYALKYLVTMSWPKYRMHLTRKPSRDILADTK